MINRSYKGAKRQEIRFPIGGIGTGCIGLDGTGRFRDWEIFNRPAKGSLNGFSHFGIKAEKGGVTLDARVMHADLLGPYTGQGDGYGYGPDRRLMAAVPHFRDSVFYGEFPLARVEFGDDTFPGLVSLQAFNPFIPGNEDDSSIPAAFLTPCVTNDTGDELTYTIELSVSNPSSRNHVHSAVRTRAFQGVLLGDDQHNAEHPKYGALIFGVPAGEDAQIQLYWYRGSWFDSLGVFWQDFTAPGRLKERTYDAPSGGEDTATIALSRTLKPGETWQPRFIMGWYYPNCANYWSHPAVSDDDWDRNPDLIKTRTWKNWYAKLFDSPQAVADYAFAQWDRLEEETALFHDALYASTLPPAAMEAVGATISVLKSATVFRLSDGQFYGFEGCNATTGSCEGSCTHVWNYAMALPFLFPRLERSMRELDYTYNQREDGGMPFRLQLPLGKERSSFRPCVDGQMGGIIKTYREWKLLGDDEWLRALWPRVKKSLEFAWSPTNADRWDPDRTGVITGRQHHTLDMELFGPNAWLNGFYVGALKAAAEMADAMGDDDAALYTRLYEQGRAYTDAQLFNGEYYYQRIDVRDKSVLAPYAQSDTLIGGDAMHTYWSDEAGQIKYQLAEGCGIDQVLAQWMCELAGVGEILDQTHVESALHAIFRHNYKPSFRSHFNPCRVFALNDDAGMVIFDWPDGVEKPVVPVPYSEESMHGFEYQAAVHMIRHGMEAQGMTAVNAIRARYDGEKRNPWNEMECGSNYARSMASYALLLTYSGFQFDMRRGRMGMMPLHEGQYFFSCEGGWGVMNWQGGAARLKLLCGCLTLKEWVTPNAATAAQVTLNGKNIDFTPTDGAVTLNGGVTLTAGDELCAC